MKGKAKYRQQRRQNERRDARWSLFEDAIDEIIRREQETDEMLAQAEKDLGLAA